MFCSDHRWTHTGRVHKELVDDFYNQGKINVMEYGYCSESIVRTRYEDIVANHKSDTTQKLIEIDNVQLNFTHTNVLQVLSSN